MEIFKPITPATISKKDKIKSENLKDLISRNSYRSGIKKTAKHYSEPLAAMMGGLL